MKILIVDDSEFERNVLKSVIEKDGHEVIEAKDGQEGLDKVKSHAPDLVITDILMPNVDGFHFLRNIKKNKNLKSVPVIVYSGVYGGDKDRELALKLGAASCIAKPEKPEEIWESVKALIDKIETQKAFSESALVEDDERFLKNYSQIVAARLEAKVKELKEEAEERKRYNEEIYLLQSITLGITSSRNLHDALVFTMQKICNFTGWVYGEAWMPNHANTLLVRNHRFYSYRDNFEIFTERSGEFTFPPGVGLPGLAWSEKQPVWVRDVTIDPNYLRTSIAREAGLKTGIAFPIIADNEVVAVIVFYHLKVEERNERLIKLILSVLSQIGLVIKRIQAEDALRVSEEKLRAILDHTPSLVYAKDLQGRYIFLNKQHERVFNMKIFEIIGKTDHECIPEELADTYTAEDQKVIESKMPVKLENVLPNDDGLHTYITTKFPLFDPTGAIYAVCGISTDITERRRAEEVQSRLREQLYHAQRLASIGNLAGGVAHNFNNLLTVVMGYASLLLAEMKKDDPLSDYAQKIVNSAQIAANLTQDLLTFSRKQPTNPQPVNVNEIIKKSEGMLSKLIKENIELKTMFTDKDCIVMADTDQIKHVLINLATNARDAMPEGGSLKISTDIIEIDGTFINTHGYGEAGKYALISVSDTGLGMDEDTRLRVFDPFFTTKEVGKGTGLGLAIVYGLVKEHHGYIDVDSEPGKGTTFRIYLPMIETEARQRTARTAVFKGGTETILLAEDESEVRELIKIVFEGSGYRVIEASDGEDAIAKFIKNKDDIDLLVFDLIMPKKNGKEAYDAIKKLRPDMQVLFLSGYGDNVINKTDVHKEGLDYILKPVSPAELLENAREALDK
ncbi:MAG: response regulator [Candidatus Brocadiales bacterium]|nr:response regulator [Candidatus Brocadiales bacterium]